ncbi:MAG: hypothetical protein ABI665_03735, partial [Vicinamibacterales bacterium]
MKRRIVAIVALLALAAPVRAQDQIDISQANIQRSAPDVATWPITTAITRLDLGASDCNVEFSMKEVWPNVPIPGWGGGSIAYTLWMVRIVNGQTHAGGGIEFWNGTTGTPTRIGGCGPAASYIANWFYDASWGPLHTAGELTPGETVGFFVTAGDARAKDVRTVTARSSVVSVRWPGGSGGSFTFDGPVAPPPPVIVPPPVVIPPPVVVPPPVVQPPPVVISGPDYTEQLRQIISAQQAELALAQDTNAQVRELNKSFGETIGRAMK